MKLFYGEIHPEVKLHADEEHHILKVLRMKDGDEIHVTDGNGNLAYGTIETKGKKIVFHPIKIEKNLADSSSQLHIAIAPTKNLDRTEFFLEKAIEMGISEITFLKTENSERKNINIEKLQKKAWSACKQSLRFHFPKVNGLTPLSEFIKNIDTENTFIAHCNKNFRREALHEIKQGEKITFLVGPEGDFSDHEIQLLSEKNITAVSLGHQRLRTETAGVFIAAWRYYETFSQ